MTADTSGKQHPPGLLSRTGEERPYLGVGLPTGGQRREAHVRLPRWAFGGVRGLLFLLRVALKPTPPPLKEKKRRELKAKAQALWAHS